MHGTNQNATRGQSHVAVSRNPRRREFIKTAATVSAAALIAGRSEDARAGLAVDQSSLPQVRLGRYSISRLVCGANPFNGGSHLSVFVNQAMKEYFTPEQILKTLRRCQEVGINCWQSNLSNAELYRDFRDAGLQMNYIAIDAKGPESIEKLASCGCVAIAHHGEVTDRLFKTGQIDKMHDYLKQVRDAGLLVGVSTHMPAVIDAVESRGWDVDYYMACIYERHRSREELKELLGYTPIPEREVYLEEDPARMFRAIQQTKRPCLAFKILAAGRLSDRRSWVERAFRETFQSIKPTDGVIVGMYDRYSDQAAENAAFVRRFSSK